VILVDTSVWSLAFRRRRSDSDEPTEARVLRELIEADEKIALAGIVLQEVLSGLGEKLSLKDWKKPWQAFHSFSQQNRPISKLPG
jgi:predicted nucleic acid-binding protein